MTRRLRRRRNKRVRLPLSRLLLDFEFGSRSEPEFEASINRRARMFPQLIRPFSDPLFDGAHTLVPLKK